MVLKRRGPDSLHSWLVTAGLTFVSMILYSVVRLSGVLFVASMDRFGVDRKSASLPYILTDFIQAISSPLTGFLASKFGARLVMVLGCFVSGVGIATCFFAQTIEAVTVCWGVIFGVGFGLSVPLLALVITQHFVEKRAIAIGIVYFGGYVGYSALPTIVEHLIEYYGLSGTFLLIAGIMLNCIPVALLLRRPKLSIKDKMSSSLDESDLVRSREDDMSNNGVNPKGVANRGFELDCDVKNLKASKELKGGGNAEDPIGCKGVANYNLELRDNIKNWSAAKELEGAENVENPTDCRDVTNYNLEIRDNIKNWRATKKLEGSGNAENPTEGVVGYNLDLKANIKNLNGTKLSEGSENTRNAADCKDMGYFDVELSSSSLKLNNKGEHNHQNTTLSNSSTLRVEEYTKLNNKKGQQPLRAFKVFLEPVYMVVLVAEAVFEGSFIAFVTILVDFSLDVGLAASDTKFVLLAFSIFSNVGLVSFGWVTDDGYLSLTTFSGVLLVLRCATSAFIPFSRSLSVLLTAVALHGLCEAPLSNLFPLIIAEYYAPEVHGVAISCRLFLCAPVYLVTPTLIGYFRDGLGSYFYLFLVISVCSFMSGVLCYFIPQLSRFRCGREGSLLRKR